MGLFLFNTQGEFQIEICRGMAVRAEQLGYNLAVFACYGNYGTNKKFGVGEMAIFDLPEYDKLSGIVVAFDTFNIPEAREFILDKIKKCASCPVVSLREALDGVNNVLIDERHSIEGVLRHIIEDHGKKNIAFMTGTKGRFDAEERLGCYKRIMKEYNLPVGEHSVFYGDYWKTKGKEACDWFIQDGRYPEAIICANDMMAMSVVTELYARGITVPGDVLVTGYDGIDEGRIYSPSLTTVYVDFMDMAVQAVDIIDRHQEDDTTEEVFVKTRVIPRESCGCMDMGQISTISHRCRNFRKIMHQENLEMQISFMSIDFSAINEIDEMQEIISRYIYNIENFKNYFLCLCDGLEQTDTDTRLHKYTDKMHVWAGVKDRINMGKVDIPFDKSSLLPSEFMDKSPQCYFFYPIHFQDDCFGYEAYSFQDNDLISGAYARWSIAVSNAIESMLEQKKMNNLISELENMYVQDVLTGLYNRRGFEKYARMQFSKARAKDSTICVLGIDMDGLKPINDIYGHHEGDSALRAVGYAIQEAALPGQIGARIGGDEFEVIFPCRNEEDVRFWVKTFEQSLENYNNKSLKPYDVHASWGYKIGIPTANDTIESYMSESDDLMYKNKVANKRKRNESFR